MQLWWHGGRGISEVTSWRHRGQLHFEGHEWVTASRLAVWFPVGETWIDSPPHVLQQSTMLKGLFRPPMVRSRLSWASPIGGKTLLLLFRLTRCLASFPGSRSWACFPFTVRGKQLAVPLLPPPLSPPPPPPGSQASPLPYSVSSLDPYLLLTTCAHMGLRTPSPSKSLAWSHK